MQPYVEALLTGAIVIQFWGLVALLYLFPSGFPATRVSRWAFRATTCCVSIILVVGVMRPGPLDLSGRDNPLGLDSNVLRPTFEYGIIVIGIGGLFGVGALVGRYRGAGAVERAQLKWFVSASASVVLLVALITFVPDVAHANLLRGAIEFATVVVGYWALPATIVISVLRYRLYDIDRLISRTITYTVVIALLTVVDAGGVLMLPGLLRAQGDLAVAASTLAVAVLFNPLRRRVRDMVDRRSNRPRYESEREVERFGAGADGQPPDRIVHIVDRVARLAASSSTRMSVMYTIGSPLRLPSPAHPSTTASAHDGDERCRYGTNTTRHRERVGAAVRIWRHHLHGRESNQGSIS